MSHQPLWYTQKLSEEIIDKAVAEFMAIPPRDANMGEGGEITNHGFRSTTIRFVPNDHWFGEILFNFAKEANTQCGWNYDISGHEAVQYGEYGPGQHYNWHMDYFTLGTLPVDRKVSISCLMCEPDSFTGGELRLQLYQDYTPVLEKGTMIAFPSIIYHCVEPVLTGTRFSSVIWTNGPKFR